MPTANWIAWAALPRAERVVAAILNVIKISDGSTVPLYWATRAGSWDGSHHFKGVLQGMPSFARNLSELEGGQSTLTVGDLVALIQWEYHADSENEITMNDLVGGGYSFDGAITLYSGGPDLDWADWAVAFTGRVSPFEADNRRVNIPLKAPDAIVAAKQMPPNVLELDAFDEWQASESVALGAIRVPTVPNSHFYYCVAAGTTGGTEPTWLTTNGITVADSGATWLCCQIPDSSAGLPLPIVPGWAFNKPLLLIDETSFIYMGFDPAYGPAQALDAVYIDGLLKTSGVDYTAGTDNCTVKMAADPGGTPTADMRGLKYGGSFVDKCGDLIAAILVTFGGVSAGDLVSADFAALNTAVPYSLGLDISSSYDIATVLDELVRGLAVAWGVKRDGTWSVGKLATPSVTPDLELTEYTILREPSPSVGHDPRIVWRCTIAGERNWDPNGNPDSTVTQDRRGWLKREFRERTAANSSILTLYPSASDDGPHETALKSMADCATVAADWLDLYGAQTRVVRVATKLKGLQVHPLQTVKLTRSRHGMAAGWSGVVIGIDESSEGGRTITELRLRGT